MVKQVITISREFGSGGRTVGKLVGQSLDIPYYDKDLVKKVAVDTGFDIEFVEQKSESVSRFRNLFSSAFAGMGSNQPMNGLTAEDFLWVMQCQAILDLASSGPCVIVGRCADFILRDRKDVLNVFIYADNAFRADRIVRLYGEGEANPEKRLEVKDRERRTFYKHYTGREWGVYTNYDLCLNTSVIGVERAAEIVCEIVKNPVTETK